MNGVLSLLTLGVLPVIWRGSWDPADDRFAGRMLATLIVTIVTSFHSHVHGAAILLVPGMLLAAGGGGRPPLPLLLRVGLVLPTLLFFLTRATNLVAVIFMLLMLICLAFLVASEVIGLPRLIGTFDSSDPADLGQPALKP